MPYNYLSACAIAHQHNRINDLSISTNLTQYNSKKWLCDTLKQQTNLPVAPSILILGAWYGSLLVPMLLDAFDPSCITLNDIDPIVLECAQALHGLDKCRYEVFDVEEFAKHRDRFAVDIVINTSCEHMQNIKEIVINNPECLYVFQSCDNKNDPGHINTASSTKDFVVQTGITTVTFQGRLNLGHKNRFMVIGYKNKINVL